MLSHRCDSALLRVSQPRRLCLRQLRPPPLLAPHLRPPLSGKLDPMSSRFQSSARATFRTLVLASVHFQALHQVPPAQVPPGPAASSPFYQARIVQRFQRAVSAARAQLGPTARAEDQEAAESNTVNGPAQRSSSAPAGPRFSSLCHKKKLGHNPTVLVQGW